MEMKLNHQLIKELRLRNSWSQEKLAEISNLNPRTIQRVEAEGTGSLQTRARLARAFSIEPSALDFPEPRSADMALATGPAELSPPKARLSLTAKNYSHLPLLLLITCIYLAWTPIYFDLSVTSFFYGDFVQFFRVSWLWLAVLVGVWVALSAVWLTVVFRKNKETLYLHACYVTTPLIFGVVRIWLPELVMYLLSFALYLAGLALLVSFYKPQLDSKRIRYAFNISLVNYVFLWCFHSVLYSFAFGAMYRWQNGLDFQAPWISFSNFLVRTLSNVTYLLPVVLVMLFSLGRDKDSTNSPGNRFSAGLKGLKKWLVNSSQRKELPSKELA